jgi:hypothetical protein
MSRCGSRKRPTVEGCLLIDVRRWHRDGLLRSGRTVSWSWYRRGKPLGTIEVTPTCNAAVLQVRWLGSKQEKSNPNEQRVPLVWTRCHFGGARPWFRCTGHSDGQGCGRRAAKLYLGRRSALACRGCYDLAYASQQEIPRHRAISRAQKIRMRLGGSPNLSDPLPKKPRGMHRWTYYRLFAKAMAAQERSIALDLDYMRRHYLGLLREEDVVGR